MESRKPAAGAAGGEEAKAFAAALRWLTVRPRTRRELADKLRDRGFSTSASAAVLARLAGLGYVDDEAFAMQWAETAARVKAFGPLRIEKDLRRRGIERSLAVKAAKEAAGEKDEEKLAGEVIMQRIARDGWPRDQRSRRRLLGHLTRRGFTAGAALRALRGIRGGGGSE